MKAITTLSTLMLATALFLPGCGTELDKPYEDQKGKSKETEDSLEKTSAELALLKEMWSNTLHTPNYVWTWVVNRPDYPYSVAKIFAPASDLIFRVKACWPRRMQIS